jgi:hypothetical protein
MRILDSLAHGRPRSKNRHPRSIIVRRTSNERIAKFACGIGVALF